MGMSDSRSRGSRFSEVKVTELVWINVWRMKAEDGSSPGQGHAKSSPLRMKVNDTWDLWQEFMIVRIWCVHLLNVSVSPKNVFQH